VSLRMSNGSIIKGNRFRDTFWPVRITGLNHKILNNYFEKSCENSIIFMKESSVYRKTQNILIENNTFEKNISLVLLETKQSFGFPTNIQFTNNFIGSSSKRKNSNRVIGNEFFKYPNLKKTRKDGISE